MSYVRTILALLAQSVTTVLVLVSQESTSRFGLGRVIVEVPVKIRELSPTSTRVDMPEMVG